LGLALLGTKICKKQSSLPTYKCYTSHKKRDKDKHSSLLHQCFAADITPATKNVPKANTPTYFMPALQQMLN
jgi:hypothetical protein